MTTKTVTKHFNDRHESQTLEWLVKELFRILDIVEESDEGNLFHPNVIRSCRVMDTQQLNAVIIELRKRVGL